MSTDPNPTAPSVPPSICTGIVDVFHGDADAIRKRGQTLAGALKEAKDDGLVLLLIKCTEGGNGPSSGKPYIDPAFDDWLDAAIATNVEFGTYHVGTDSQDGGGQADFYEDTLTHAGIIACSSLCSLDRELGKPPMSPLHAERFVTGWRALTKRWPLYYRSLAALRGDYANVASPSLKLCPTWVAAYGQFGDYGPHTPVPWWLWQDMGAESGPGERPADPVRFPRTIAGLGKVDKNVYAGTAAQLLAALPTIGA